MNQGLPKIDFKDPKVQQSLRDYIEDFMRYKGRKIEVSSFIGQGPICVEVVVHAKDNARDGDIFTESQRVLLDISEAGELLQRLHSAIGQNADRVQELEEENSFLKTLISKAVERSLNG